MDSFFWIYYRLPAWVITFVVCVSILVMGALGRECCDVHHQSRKKRVFKICCSVLLAFYLVFVLWYTIFSRSPGTDRSLFPVPLYRLLFGVKYSRDEVPRGYIMNAFLFWPIGLFTCWLFEGEIKKRILKAATLAFLFSFGIELIQYIFALGTAEADDIIFNTLGASVGAHSVLLMKDIIKDCSDYDRSSETVH